METFRKEKKEEHIGLPFFICVFWKFLNKNRTNLYTTVPRIGIISDGSFIFL